MRKCFWFCVVCLSSMGCGPDGPSIDPKDVPDSIMIYSIDFEALEFNRIPKDAELFCNYPIFGKTNVINADKCAVAIAIRDSLNSKDNSPAACFWPRHGVRYVKNNETTDYLICFQCKHYYKWIDGISTNDRFELIGPEAEIVLDRYLTAANVKLAPKIKE